MQKCIYKTKISHIKIFLGVFSLMFFASTMFATLSAPFIAPKVLIIASNPGERYSEILDSIPPNYPQINIFKNNLAYAYPELYYAANVIKEALKIYPTPGDVVFLYGINANLSNSSQPQTTVEYASQYLINNNISIDSSYVLEANVSFLKQMLSSENLTFVYSSGDGMPTGFSLNEKLKPSFFSAEMLPETLENISWVACSCQIFNNPFLAEVQQKNIKFFMGGLTSLDWFSAAYLASNFFINGILNNTNSENLTTIFNSVYTSNEFANICNFSESFFQESNPNLNTRYGFYSSNERLITENPNLFLNSQVNVSATSNIAESVINLSWSETNDSTLFTFGALIQQFNQNIEPNTTFISPAAGNLFQVQLNSLNNIIPAGQTENLPALFQVMVFSQYSGVSSNYYLITTQETSYGGGNYSTTSISPSTEIVNFPW